MALVQALVGPNSGFASPVIYTATGDLFEHQDASTNGVNFTAGSDLIVVVASAANVTSVGVNGDTTAVSTADFSSGDTDFFTIPSIGSGVTSIYINQDASSTPRVFIFEDSATLTKDPNWDRTALATAAGFSTAHDIEYTTSNLGSTALVLAFIVTGFGVDFFGVGDSLPLSRDNAETRAMIYEDVAINTTDDLAWTQGNQNATVTAVSYYRPAVASGRPQGPLGHVFKGSFGGPL